MKTTLTTSNAKPTAKTILMAGLTLMMTAACSGGKHSIAKGSELKFESVEPVIEAGYYMSLQLDENSKPLLLAVQRSADMKSTKSFVASSVKCGSHIDSVFRFGGLVMTVFPTGTSEVSGGKTMFSDCDYEISAKALDRESKLLAATVLIKEKDKDEVKEAIPLVAVDEAAFLAVLKMMKVQYPDFQAKDEACEGVTGKKCDVLFQSEPVTPVE